MSKINYNDTIIEVITKLSEGNPGALSVLSELIESYNGDTLKLLPEYLTIDSMELYGSQLYMLWNDCCNRKIEKVKKVLELYRKGKINSNDIDERIKNVGYGKSFDDLIERNFGLIKENENE